jgi:hypothetical protein
VRGVVDVAGAGGCQRRRRDSAEGALKKQSWNVRIVGLGVGAA